MTQTKFEFANSSEPAPGDGHLPSKFSIKTSSSTDIWTKPPSTDRFNAPVLYRNTPLKSFKRAQVSFNANWQEKYDQGGLILVANNADGTRKWVKTGIELTHGKAHLSTVSKDRWADWSLVPIPSGGIAATIEAVREPDGSLWIYLVEGSQKSPLREITWFFEDDSIDDCWVGVFAARPSNEGGDFTVNFEELVIDLTE